ncbi:hypothetical protein [Paraglaciecola arctica]|uniref:Uncharacterized protein n=1 Tax=Paraglaciecola arctica BSs20135 TaxID=493475 RepID=K6YQC6_9ALTE|nr:hypothetical protein [Paraglaciecola arctica]GAC18813.1 hypothetical protein GARC_1845 [Paraglaciecola arctica BSs20135]
MVLRVVLLITINFLIACSSSATSTDDYIVVAESDLPDELKETSGLYCPEVGSAYTVNDSGNKPIIYKIDHAGRIIGKTIVASKNTDWEALTGDSEHFYIGDVGNNNGKRKFVQIHGVDKQNGKTEGNVSTMSLFYSNNDVKNNEYLNHDFDAETLISVDDSLFLFSKSWKTGTLFIYQVNKTQAEQFVEHISEVKGLPGIITGGDFDRKNSRFILVGYGAQLLGRITPFIVILNRDFTLQTSFELSGYGQVEGVCVSSNGEVWFTQESSLLSKHKLVKLKVTK